MRIAEVARLFAGSCFIYVVVAACGAYSEEDKATSSSGGSSSGNASSTSSSGTTITDPIGNALAEGHKSGTRLKLRFYEGSDGSRQFIDFYDSELKTTCTVPVTTADGKTRCVPASTGLPWFTTSDCTGAPVFYAVAKADPQPAVLVVAMLGVPPSAYRPGALATPGSGHFMRTMTGLCVSVTADPANFNYYSVGAPLADSAFVEMTIKNE